MPTPTRSQTLGDDVIGTRDTLIRNTPADVIFNRNLLLSILWKSQKERGVAGPTIASSLRTGRVLKQSGREFWIPVNTGRSTNFSWFRKADTVGTNVDEGLTRQFALPAYAQDGAFMTWQDKLENSSPEGQVDIWKSKIDRVYATMAETLEGDLFSANADTSATQKEVIGLRHMISTTGDASGTVWGIDRATYTWQRHQYTASVGTLATNLLSAMRHMITLCSGTNNCDMPTLWLTNATIWEGLVEQLEAIHRIVDTKVTADLSFPAVTHMGLPVFFSGNSPSGEMRCLNMNYWWMVTTPGADFTVKNVPSPADQVMEDGVRILKALQWGCERYDRQGLLGGIS